MIRFLYVFQSVSITHEKLIHLDQQSGTFLPSGIRSVEEAQEMLEYLCDFLDVTENLWFEVETLT